MKNLHSMLFTLALVGLISSNTIAQTAIFDEAVGVAAQSICDCANQTFNMNENVEDAFIHMLELKDEAAVNSYLTGLSEDLQLGVMEAAANMQDMEGDAGFNQCVLGVENALKPYEDKLKDGNYTEADFQKGIIEKLEGSKQCKLTYLLVKLSLQLDNTDKVIEQNNNTKKSIDENNDPRYGSGGNTND